MDSEQRRDLDRVASFLAGADTDQPFDLGDPNLAVADLTGLGCFDYSVQHFVLNRLVDDDFHFQFRNEVDLVFGTAIGWRLRR